jgi:V8-like Glu-specific endopeptidase
MIRFALICAAALVAAPAFAGDTAARRMLPAHEQLEWRGVGRLNIEGGGYCTATLMSETLVITAAHCLFDDDGRRNDADLWFAAGYRDGKWEAIRRARRTAVHPDYVSTPGPRANAAQTAADIALIELDAPVMGAAIPHYPAADLPGEDGAVALLSYGRGRDNALSLQEPCRVTGRRNATARLTCEVAPGSSGSPVFRRGINGTPQMVAVISGHSGGSSYAVALDTALRPLRAVLDAKGPRRKTVGARSTSGTRTGGGVRMATPGGASASSGPRLQGGSAWKPKRPPGG